jgi:hypothetical protein
VNYHGSINTGVINHGSGHVVNAGRDAHVSFGDRT